LVSVGRGRRAVGRGLAYADKTRLHWYATGSEPVATVAAPEPDRVVGVVHQCDLVGTSATTPPSRTTTEAFRTGGCSAVNEKYKMNDHQEVTVRNSAGGSYVVSVPATANVFVGMAWPP
jgi:hypothetical protein